MMLRTQISLSSETQRQARQRAAQLGVSLAEYIRRLIARDLGPTVDQVDPSLVFDLGSSGGSDIRRDKASLIGEAVSAPSSPERKKQ
jgi:hypothetical protein